MNKLKQIKLKNSANLPKQNIKNEKNNKSNTNINSGNKSDINININKEINNMVISDDNKQINENSTNMITHGKLNIDKNAEKNIDNGNNMETEKNIEENKIEMDEINKDKDSNEIIDINNNNYNGMSNGKHNMNEDIDENDDNIIKEIIVKDVSTSDKRLNVFIKYIEMSKFNNKSDAFVLLNAFQTDSFYFQASKPKNYYNNQSKNSKLQKILSSIIEEEEKSKAAGSVNNSVISEEEICKNGNYSHFFIQSVKYVTNFLQSVINDKKKDLSFQFFKILKRIKNEAFLKGLMNQKNFQSVSKLKDDEENENMKIILRVK